MDNINEIIDKYLNGEDINNIELLEQNPTFMYMALFKTRDVNMLRMCAEELFVNSEFVKKVIKLFKDKKEVVEKILEYYLNKSNDEKGKEEVMVDIINQHNGKSLVGTCHLKMLCRYYMFRSDADNISNPAVKKETGLGFNLMQDGVEYQSEDVTIHYAKLMLLEIFEAKIRSLEEFVHLNYTNREYVTTNKFMVLIEIISMYDLALAEYVQSNRDLVLKEIKEMDTICNNWDRFYDVLEPQRYAVLFEAFHNYYMANDCDYYFDEFNTLYFIANELGVVETLFKYDNIKEDEFEEILKEVCAWDDFMFSDEAIEHMDNLKRIVEFVLDMEVPKIENVKIKKIEKVIDLERYRNKRSNY